MSRRNPNQSEHPCNRWFEWNGEKGCIKFYDKEEEANIEIDPKLTFLVLDELATITGFDKPNKCGIYSNEVRNTVNDYLTVKSHKGGEIAHGLYQDIKDKVKAVGGKYTDNIYIAFKDELGKLVIGALRLKGAAFSAWMDFKKGNKKAINEQAIRLHGFEDKEEGSISFRVPIFKVQDVDPDTHEAAMLLDDELQEYLNAYFIRKNKMPTSEGESFVPNAEYYKPDETAEEPTAEEKSEAVVEAQSPEIKRTEKSLLDDPADDLPF